MTFRVKTLGLALAFAACGLLASAPVAFATDAPATPAPAATTPATPDPTVPDPANPIICKYFDVPTGTRLGRGGRVCMHKAYWDQREREDHERLQKFQEDHQAPPGVTGGS